MELLITPQEVVETAFEGEYGVTADRIGETVITAAQQKFIRPVIGGLYSRIEAGEYPELAQKIKVVLAHYVKLLMIPQLAVSLGNGGITQLKSGNFAPAAGDSLKALRDNTKACVGAMMRNLVEYIEENQADYPEYDPADNILHQVSISSGIIL